MKILVTGAKGFVGKNLIAELRARKYEDIFEYDIDSRIEDLEKACKEVNFIFHLAGVNRPKEQSEFMEGNFGFTNTLLNLLKKHNNKAPLMISSSIQAALDNPYGKSKKAGEDLVFEYGRENNVKVLVYRFQNIFGKWSRPNYNSAVATFCYNISRGLDIMVSDPNAVVNLVYIDDVVKELINALEGNPTKDNEFCKVKTSYKVTLDELTKTIYSFKTEKFDLFVPDMKNDFVRKLYATYLSFLPIESFSYNLKMNVDHRGSFTEFLKTDDKGQVSVNISKPGIVKGNHWHHTKCEKFLVVFGKGVIRFREIHSTEVIEVYVSGDILEVVNIMPGYTHNIENIGETDLVTIMWASEAFDPNNPDTYFLEV